MHRHWIAIALSLASLRASAALELNFRVTTTPLLPSNPSDKKPEPPQKSTRHVILGGTFSQVDGEGGRTIRDYTTRRSYLTHDGKTRNVSLFAEVGGRVAEIENRVALAEVMEKGGVKDVMNVAEAEQELSILAENSKTKIDRAEKDGVVRFTSSGETLAEWSTDAVPVSEAEGKEFVRFVRIGVGMHPVILEDLAKINAIPRHMHTHSMGEDLDLDLVDAKKSDVTSYTTAPTVSPLDENPQTAAIVARVKPAMLDAVLKKDIDDAEIAVKEKRYLEAMLGYLEYTLIAGGNLPAEFAAYKDEITANGAVKTFLGSMSPRNAPEAKEAIGRLERLHKAAKTKKYVLQIMEADFHSNLRDPDAAMTNFMAALKEQPLITGVWKDMGDVYYRTYDATTAWACWEIARSIAPLHPNLKSIDNNEQHLLHAYSGFF